MSICGLNMLDMKEQSVPLSQYQDRVLLIMNTMTGCGLTLQHEGLENLYQKYRGHGFEILDFPCNQFGHQVPGSEEEIQSFCQLICHVTFPQFAKIEAGGPNESPLYTYLKSQQKGVPGSNVKWNLTKSLVGRNGNMISRYTPSDKPENLETDILVLL